MAEIEAVCGGKTRVHSFPIEAVPELKTNDSEAERVALDNQGCGYCLAREICEPGVKLIKVAEGKPSKKINAGATVTPGVARLKSAGII